MDGNGSQPRLQIVLGQISCKVGALDENAAQIVKAAKQAGEADILLLPELSICGYPPEDLLAYDEFIYSCEQAAASAAAEIAVQAAAGLHVAIGLPRRIDGKLYNALQLVHAGRVVAEHHKMHLPNYGVFDEMRHFSPGEGPTVASIGPGSVGLAICHDIWVDEFRREIARQQPDVLLVANASPFYLGVQHDREQHTAAIARQGIEVAYVNMVGAQDEHVFDGGSHHVAAGGMLTRRSRRFRHHLHSSQEDVIEPEPEQDEQIACALEEGVRSYVQSAGGGPVFVGLSGGIDSAVVLCVAAAAVGAEKTTAVLMPSRHTAQMSIDDASSLAENLGVQSHVLHIEAAVAAVTAALGQAVPHKLSDVATENIQSRIRGLLLMALANDANGLVLTTGNKSEMATGYATLYGDMAGAFDVLKDLVKRRVYELARYFNRDGEVIPQRILDRPPTAELRPDQLDSDSLPDYDVLDGILEAVVERLESPRQVAAELGRGETDQFVELLSRSEFKRRQAPIGPTITRRAFGKDWRMPVANAYRFKRHADD